MSQEVKDRVAEHVESMVRPTSITSKEFPVTIDSRDVNLLFRRPDQEELFQLDKQYRRIFSEAIKEGIVTELQARKIFKENGTWTDDDTRKIREAGAALARLTMVLKAVENPEDPEAIELFLNVTELRAQLNARLFEQQEAFSQTAEGLAAEQKMHLFIALCCIDKETDERYFESFDQYKLFVRTHPDQMAEIHKEAYFFEYRLPEDIAEDWGEIQFAKRFEKHVKDKAEQDARETEILKKEAATKRRRTAAIAKNKAKKKTTKKKTTKKRVSRTVKK